MEYNSPYLQEVLRRHPKQKKHILEFINRFTIINGVFVDTEIFNYTYRCTYPGCGICCFAGTSVTMNEVSRVKKAIDRIKPYLSEANNKRLHTLNNRFWRKHYIEDLYRLRTWNASCIFLMEDKRCAVHTYCLNNDVDWIAFHFDLCVTYPLRITKRIIHLEEELFTKEYVLPCFNEKGGDDGTEDAQDVIQYLKEVIIDRFDLEFWNVLASRAREKK